MSKKAAEHFDAGNWREIGLLTEQPDVIERHARLLRSLSFGDEDYPGNVLEVLQKIVRLNDQALEIVEGYITERFPQEGTFVSSVAASRVITFSPSVFHVPDGLPEGDLVAVMMPFQHQFGSVYASIQQACQLAGQRCLRADDIWEHATIMQDIFALIFRATIVIVDFTGKNPNVMYETGIAHTLGKHVVPITQSLDDVPFDIRHHRVLKYLPNSEGLSVLQSSLSSRLRSLSR